MKSYQMLSRNYTNTLMTLTLTLLFSKECSKGTIKIKCYQKNDWLYMYIHIKLYMYTMSISI